MDAIIVTGPGAAELGQVSDPEPAPGEALVAIERAGVCGTDLSILSGKIPVAYPRILGHELIGAVVDVNGATDVSPGDRVLIDPTRACGTCRECRRDRANICPNGSLMGRDVDGGFAQYVCVDTNQVHAIPGGLPAEHSTMLQVLGVCIHAQESFDVFPGQRAAVVGLGVSGMLMVQLLRARGVDTVVGITRSESKRRLAHELGATATTTPDNASRVVDEATGGLGADVVIECVGTVPTLAQAIDLAGLAGTVVLFGTITDSHADLPFYELYRKELTVRNPRAALPRNYALAVEMLARGQIQVDQLLSVTYPLTQGSEALQALATSSGLLKVVLEVA